MLNTDKIKHNRELKTELIFWHYSKFKSPSVYRCFTSLKDLYIYMVPLHSLCFLINKSGSFLSLIFIKVTGSQMCIIVNGWGEAG